jgi:hypothetical protein
MCSTLWSLVVEILSRPQGNVLILLSPFKFSNLGKLLRQICQKDCSSAVGNCLMRAFCSKLVLRSETHTIIPTMRLACTPRRVLVLIYDCVYGSLACRIDQSLRYGFVPGRSSERVVISTAVQNFLSQLCLGTVAEHICHMPDFLIYNILGTPFYV